MAIPALRSNLIPLAHADRGATVLEFAFVAPVMLLLLLGGLDIGLRIYVRSVLEGEMAKAGRDSSLESGTNSTTQTNLDTRVQTMINQVMRTANVSFTRTSFSSYARVQNRAEPFIDANNNGLCDNGETYQDSNRNSRWDADSGLSGAGGANDALLYTATVTYPSILPLSAILGQGSNVTISASTVLRNQPYTDTAPVVSRTCP